MAKPLTIGIPAEALDRALESLTSRERVVIELRRGLKGDRAWTCEGIGRQYGITATKIQHIENHAVEKLKLWSSSEEM